MQTSAQAFKNSVVVSYHPIATAIGEQILNQGGNAFDAFVATTAAQYVLSEGVTSLAGPLGAVLYQSKSKEVYYLDAGFNSVINPQGKWNPEAPRAGAAVKVPGAPMALASICERFGRFSFAHDLEPAIQLAKNGFPVSPLYNFELKLFKNIAARSQYGRETFYRDGQALAVGEILKLPELAKVLEALAARGPSYMYAGDWAKQAVAAVQAHGGALTMEDFEHYQIEWRKPLSINYRGYEIFAPSGRTFGGLSTLVALKGLEHVSLQNIGNGKHYSENADALGLLARTETASEALVDNLAFIDGAQKLDRQDWIESNIGKFGDEVWQQANTNGTLSPTEAAGTHSYQVTVIDRDGNAITGTNTIESYPWGEGIFVQGIPLTAVGKLTAFDTKPGERDLEPLSMEIGLKNSQVAFASGAFSASLIPAAFQFIVNVVDYNLSAKQAATLPRFGAQAWDVKTLKMLGKGLWLDRRISPAIVEKLTKQGLKFDQEGYTDTGLGSLAVVRPDGQVEGAIAPLKDIGTPTPGFDN